MTGAEIIMRQTLLWSAIIVGILAVIGSAIGYLVDGTAGLISALIGVMVAGLFLGLTALIVLIANRMHPQSMAFFGVVGAGWFIKLIVFIGIMVVLRLQPWLSEMVFFFSLLTAVIASLVVDLVVFARARVPYVGDVELPRQSAEGGDS